MRLSFWTELYRNVVSVNQHQIYLFLENLRALCFVSLVGRLMNLKRINRIKFKGQAFRLFFKILTTFTFSFYPNETTNANQVAKYKIKQVFRII